MIGVSPGAPASVVFDADTHEKVRRRYGDVDPGVRPVLARNALDPEAASLRAWLDDEVKRLDNARLPHTLGQLRGAATHFAALAELVTASLLRDVSGLEIVPEPKVGHKTPDLLACNPVTHRPELVVEVWSRSPSRQTVEEQREWLDLSRAIGTIRASVLLRANIIDDRRSGPPGRDAREAVVAHLRKYLTGSGPKPGWSISVEGLTFQVVRTTASPTAELVPVHAFQAVDRDHVVDAIERKVHKYRELVDQLSAPLLVVLGAEPGTGLNQGLVRDVLHGQDPVVFDIAANVTGTGRSRTHQLRQTAAPPVFDASLSAVGFVEVRNGHDGRLTIWPIEGAPRALPSLLDNDRIRVQPPTANSRRT